MSKYMTNNYHAYLARFIDNYSHIHEIDFSVDNSNNLVIQEREDGMNVGPPKSIPLDIVLNYNALVISTFNKLKELTKGVDSK